MFVVSYERRLGLDRGSKMFKLLDYAISFYRKMNGKGYNCTLSDMVAK